jgi:hypothetical protein
MIRWASSLPPQTASVAVPPKSSVATKTGIDAHPHEDGVVTMNPRPPKHARIPAKKPSRDDVLITAGT